MNTDICDTLGFRSYFYHGLKDIPMSSLPYTFRNKHSAKRRKKSASCRRGLIEYLDILNRNTNFARSVIMHHQEYPGFQRIFFSDRYFAAKPR